MRVLRTWLRGLRLLRYPELVASLGREQSRLVVLRQLEARYGSFLADSVRLQGFVEDLLVLSQGVSVGHGTIFAFGDDLNGFARIEIGSGTWIGEYNNIRSGGGIVKIGKQCLISQFVTIIGSGHGLNPNVPIQLQRPSHRRGVIIGDDVWLGAGAAVMPGVTIASGTVVAAGAVVTRDTTEASIVAGIPAKKIGLRSE